jgi:hypothetical protein
MVLLSLPQSAASKRGLQIYHTIPRHDVHVHAPVASPVLSNCGHAGTPKYRTRGRRAARRRRSGAVGRPVSKVHSRLGIVQEMGLDLVVARRSGSRSRELSLGAAFVGGARRASLGQGRCTESVPSSWGMLQHESGSLFGSRVVGAGDGPQYRTLGTPKARTCSWKAASKFGKT